MRYLLMLLFMLCCQMLLSQVKEVDTLHRRYLVCTDQYKGKRHIIIREGRPLIIKNYSGKKCKGKLKVINDSTICLQDLKHQRSDTFLLDSVKRIRRPHIGRAFFSTYVIIGGLEAALIGIWLKTQKNFGHLGAGYMAIGAAEMAVGAIIFNGPHYRHTQYRYHIVETKGYKLEKKHLRPARQKMF